MKVDFSIVQRWTVKKNFLVIFSLGIVSGFFLTFTIGPKAKCHYKDVNSQFTMFEYDTNEYSNRDFHENINTDNTHHSTEIKTHDELEKSLSDKNTVAKEIEKTVRIICCVMTCPKNHPIRSSHLKATWGKRCTELLFMSTTTSEDKKIPTVVLPNLSDGKEYIWGKTKEAFMYIHKNYCDYDYVLKVDDDTYVIVENLRYMLLSYDPNEPVYLGFRHNSTTVSQGYMNGGAGYVLSRESVRRFVEKAIPNELCRQGEKGIEDFEIGKCLELVGVKAGDSRDSYGRNRFFPFHPADHLTTANRDPNFWYWKSIWYPMEDGLGCCSDIAVTFHYIKPKFMYVFEYYLYHLQPYGWSANIDLNVLEEIAMFKNKSRHRTVS